MIMIRKAILAEKVMVVGLPFILVLSIDREQFFQHLLDNSSVPIRLDNKKLQLKKQQI